jgi:hypothetical protein
MKLVARAWLALALTSPAAAATVRAKVALLVRAEPRTSARIVERVPEDARLVLVGWSDDTQWAEVRAHAHAGWVARALIVVPEPKTAKTAEPEPAPTATAEPAPEPGPATAQDDLAIAQKRPAGTASSGLLVGAAAGMAQIDRRYSSTGTAALAAYEFKSNAVAAATELGYVHRFARGALLGFDFAYAYAGASELRYQASNGVAASLSLQTHTLDGAFALGFHSRAAGGIDVALRVGAELMLTVIGYDAGVAVPSDRVIGMLAGLGVQLPRLGELGGHPVSVRLSGAAIAPGTRADNAGLAAAGARTYGGHFGGDIGVGLVDRRAGQLRLAFAYAYQFFLTQYPARSNGPTELASSQHLFTLGLAYAH